ncbi:MAG: hypothetical protein IJ952_00445, partial [Alistipes sp.]|nr:hypothetical protein [Alistipes sp.]
TITYSAPKFKKNLEASVRILNNKALLNTPWNMWVVDSVVILNTQSAENNGQFQLFSAIDGAEIGNFGFKGRGDNELTNYMRCAVNVREKSLCAIDNTNRLEVDLRAIATGSQPKMKKSKIAGIPAALHIYHFGDRLLSMGHINPRIALTNGSASDTLSSYNDFPHITTEIDQNATAKVYYYIQSSSYAVAPDGSKICHTTRNGMVMEIFDVNKAGQISLRHIRYFFPTKMKNSMRGADDCVKGVIQTRATDKYIYALYKDTTIADTKALPKLSVFNWKGDEVCQYQLDTKVIDFAITEDGSRVCCWAENADGEEYLGYFDLKEI